MLISQKFLPTAAASSSDQVVFSDYCFGRSPGPRSPHVARPELTWPAAVTCLSIEHYVAFVIAEW